MSIINDYKVGILVELVCINSLSSAATVPASDETPTATPEYTHKQVKQGNFTATLKAKFLGFIQLCTRPHLTGSTYNILYEIFANIVWTQIFQEISEKLIKYRLVLSTFFQKYRLVLSTVIKHRLVLSTFTRMRHSYSWTLL